MADRAGHWTEGAGLNGIVRAKLFIGNRGGIVSCAVVSVEDVLHRSRAMKGEMRYG